MKQIRHTIILTSILLGMTGAISLASPYKPEAQSVLALIRH